MVNDEDPLPVGWGVRYLVGARMRNQRGLSFAPRAVKTSFNASVLSVNILTLPLSCLMSTEGTRKETESGETSEGSSTATGAISEGRLEICVEGSARREPFSLSDYWTSAGRRP